MIATLEKYAPWMLGIFRIVVALVYMEHGTQKLFHFPPQERFGAAGARVAGAVRDAGHDAASALAGAADQAAAAMSSVAQALTSSSAAAPAMQGGPPPSMAGLFMIAGILETFGGLALVLGLLTRPIAFLVAGECAYIFWFMDVAHSGSIFPASNGGEVAVLFCFSFLYLLFAGSGAFALDKVIWRRKAA